MPTVENRTGRIHYECSGPSDGQPLVLVNSLGSNLHMWDKVLPTLEQNLHVLRYDMRGHGMSFVPPGPYTIDDLGADLLSLLDHAEVDRAHVCGLSLGGLVAMWIAINSPDRCRRVVLANTAACIGTRTSWDERISQVRDSGMLPLAAATLQRWFTPGYRNERAEEMEAVRQMISSISPEGYVACCGVLGDTDFRPNVNRIQSPCLVITGTHDPATPPGLGWELHTRLRHSTYVELDASHLSAWEKSQDFAQTVLAFLKGEEHSDG